MSYLHDGFELNTKVQLHQLVFKGTPSLKFEKFPKKLIKHSGTNNFYNI